MNTPKTDTKSLDNLRTKARSKFAAMVAINPALLDLQKRFDLRIDFETELQTNTTEICKLK